MKHHRLMCVLACSALATAGWGQSSPGSKTVVVNLPDAKLNFSRDGRFLRVLGHESTDQQQGPIEAMTYDVGRSTVEHAKSLADQTANVLSVTSDGRLAVISAGGEANHTPLRVFLWDTETEKQTPLPEGWYRDDRASGEDPDIRISGDGSLISVYGEGTDSSPMLVAVYRWSDKALAAKQTSGLISAGGSFGGGITPSGREVEFDNNRVGSRLVDRTTGRPLASFGPDSFRSPDGTWAVELPDLSFEDDSMPAKVLIKDGRTGKTKAEIKIPVPDQIAFGQMSGAFCGQTARALIAGGDRVAMYQLPSGKRITSFAHNVWKDPKAADPTRETVACSNDGTRVAILSGSRLTWYVLKGRRHIPAAQADASTAGHRK